MTELIEKVKDKHAVLLNSGGIDSRVVAKLAQDAGYIVHSFHIDAVPKIKDAQISASTNTSKLFCKDHFVFSFPHDWTMKKKNGHTTMPFSGMMQITAAMQYASYNGWDTVFTGLRSQGRNDKHLKKINEVFAGALNTAPVKVVAPLFNQTFSNVVELAKKLQVSLENTHSCAENPACGKCRVCILRKKAGL